MKTVYGLDAVEVEQPGGEIVLYPIAPLAAEPGEWLAWSCTSPKGDVYRVSELPSGGWKCNCKANTLGKSRGGRWQPIIVKGQEVYFCKHIKAAWSELGVPRG